MLTFMQLKVAKAQRRELTQKERAQIVDIEVARKFVRQAIEEALAASPHSQLIGGDLDRIFNNQPVHFDNLGYVPHRFERQYISRWAIQISQTQQRSRANRQTPSRRQTTRVSRVSSGSGPKSAW